MGYAEVSVNSPIAQRTAFSYAIPPSLTIRAGQAVLVPFGDKLLQGIVLELNDYPSVEETKEIESVIKPDPLLSPIQISLARWISEYYLAPLFDAVALMLPPGFQQKPLTFISALPIYDDLDLTSLTPELLDALLLVQKKGKISLKQLENALGKKRAQSIVLQLVKRKLATRSYELESIKAKPKIEHYLNLLINPEKVHQEAIRLHKKGAFNQATLLNFLLQQSDSVPWTEVKHKTNCTMAVVRALVNKGLVNLQQVEVKRDPISHADIHLSYPLALTTAQRLALQSIKASLFQVRKGGIASPVFLLHGVTGSGKTEIYLQALAEIIKLGKRGIVLVPEIALTQQTIERFVSRFPFRVAILHSKLSLGEQFDEWRRIKKGEFDVVIGPRSAIFAPQPDLGLIVIDEEHEWTYKQSDRAPRYHTRDVARKLAELTGATVILGSATPDVVTYYHAQQEDYHLLQLQERVTPNEGAPLPQVKVIDLKDELKAGNRSIFSRALSQAINRVLTDRRQVMLFLNRRGGASFLQCRKCGFVFRCRRCDVALTYHLHEDCLICHRCNYRKSALMICPKCTSPCIKLLGIGTQKLALEVSHTFPQARLLRWDSDTTKEKNAHQKILSKFRTHEADIMVGTQMIAKGLDLPMVTLVGVINADTSLNLPDFRAGERTFQLLSQVAGRAGRGISGGHVIVQTYSPKHYVIQAAAKQDYIAFYEREIAYRRQLHNPPFSQLACLTFAHVNDIICQREADRTKLLLIEEKGMRGLDDISLIGPAPAFVHRLRGRFRWQLILRGASLSGFLSKIPLPQGCIVDIDPMGLT